jgi:hypothetical protein
MSRLVYGWTDNMATSSGIAELNRQEPASSKTASYGPQKPSKWSWSVRAFLATLAVRGPARTTATPTCMNDGLIFDERLSRGGQDFMRP